MLVHNTPLNYAVGLPFLACLYESTGRAVAVTMASASVSASASATALLNMLTFLVKVFKSLYLLNLLMYLVDTLLDIRYWSEVLCSSQPHQ